MPEEERSFCQECEQWVHPDETEWGDSVYCPNCGAVIQEGELEDIFEGLEEAHEDDGDY